MMLADIWSTFWIIHFENNTIISFTLKSYLLELERIVLWRWGYQQAPDFQSFFGLIKMLRWFHAKKTSKQ